MPPTSKIKTQDDQRVAQLETKVSLMERDILLFDKYFSKIDTTIENIDALTQKMAGIIQLHDERIMNATREDIQMKQDIKDHKRETQEGIKSITEKVEAVANVLDKKIDGAVTSIQNQMKEESIKVNSLNLWKSLMQGGIGVVIFIVGVTASGFVQTLFKKLIP